MFEERDARAPAWGWLRGFAWFLVAWPLMSLLALNQFDFREWEAIVIAVFGPAAIGLALLVVEAALTGLLGRAAAVQPVPNLLRDLSNLGIALAVLLAVDVGLVTVFDDDPMIRGGDPRAATMAVTTLVFCCASALLLRAAARWVHGPARAADLGPGWDRAPQVLRFLGYLTMIPTLLVCTVMIDDELHAKPGFGAVAWVVLPALLLLGLRSAMARAPRWWARNPWEAWLRATSLALPWWALAVALALGFAALCLLAPLGVIDETMTTRGRVVAGLVLVPLGLGVLLGVGAVLLRAAPALLRTWRAARRLARDADDISAWSTTATPGQVRVTLRDGREAVFEMGEQAPTLLAWLAARTR